MSSQRLAPVAWLGSRSSTVRRSSSSVLPTAEPCGDAALLERADRLLEHPVRRLGGLADVGVAHGADALGLLRELRAADRGRAQRGHEALDLGVQLGQHRRRDLGRHPGRLRRRDRGRRLGGDQRQRGVRRVEWCDGGRTRVRFSGWCGHGILRATRSAPTSRIAQSLSRSPSSALLKGTAVEVRAKRASKHHRPTGPRHDPRRQPPLGQRADGQRVEDGAETERAAEQQADHHDGHLEAGADQPQRAAGTSRRARSSGRRAGRGRAGRRCTSRSPARTARCRRASARPAAPASPGGPAAPAWRRRRSRRRARWRWCRGRASRAAGSRAAAPRSSSATTAWPMVIGTCWVRPECSTSHGARPRSPRTIIASETPYTTRPTYSCGSRRPSRPARSWAIGPRSVSPWRARWRSGSRDHSAARLAFS